MQKVVAAFAILLGACFLTCVATVSANWITGEYRPQSENTPGGQAGNPSHSKMAKTAGKKSAKAAEKGKEIRLTGWVKEEDGKTVFVNDKDKQNWEIGNPEAVKGHEGHHVKIKAKLDEANHSVMVDQVAPTRTGKQAEKESKENK